MRGHGLMRGLGQAAVNGVVNALMFSQNAGQPGTRTRNGNAVCVHADGNMCLQRQQGLTVIMVVRGFRDGHVKAEIGIIPVNTLPCGLPQRFQGHGYAVQSFFIMPQSGVVGDIWFNCQAIFIAALDISDIGDGLKPQSTRCLRQMHKAASSLPGDNNAFILQSGQGGANHRAGDGKGFSKLMFTWQLGVGLVATVCNVAQDRLVNLLGQIRRSGWP